MKKRMNKTLKDVEFIYPHIDKPHRYDPTKERDSGELGKSVECEATAPTAHWTTDFDIDKERGIELYEEAERLLAEYKKDNPKSVKKTEELRGYKENPETPDVLRFRAKANCTDSKTGELRQKPSIYGPDLKPLQDCNIRSGSKGGIKFGASVTLNGNTGAHGVTFWLNAIQVTDPVYTNDDLDGFDAVYMSSETDPKTYDSLHDMLSDTEGNDQKSNDQENTTSPDMDDEIPF